ncbi:MAG: tyrosine-type recombinase/integrase [Deltaproteobacteria bacterium]|nr:tyrosine-type recombinase/integrase [Deltaproteobacteria bacterium]
MYELNINNVLFSLQEAIRLKQLSISTERAYLSWSRRFLTFCKTHSTEGYPTHHDVKEFLTWFAIARKVSSSTQNQHTKPAHKTSTQNQAFAALLMLCGEVLDIPLNKMSASVRAKRSQRLPVVLSRNEVKKVIAQVDSKFALPLQLLYGTGMRLSEVIRLRVKDIDFGLKTITVRDGKGSKDRTTLLPASLTASLEKQIKRVKKFMSLTCIKITAPFICPTPFQLNIPMLNDSSAGNGFFLTTPCRSTPEPAP